MNVFLFGIVRISVRLRKDLPSKTRTFQRSLRYLILYPNDCKQHKENELFVDVVQALVDDIEMLLNVPLSSLYNGADITLGSS